MTRPAMRHACWAFLTLVAGGTSTACIKPPEIVMVDRATALEQEASGSFDDVEQRLNRAAIEPRPVPLTPEQLEALGAKGSTASHGTRGDNAEVSFADRVDALLLQHCLGEGADGLLAETSEACRGAADPDEVTRLVEDTNRARRQLWRWMHAQREGTPLDDLRRAWREAHLRGVVCGGWVEEAGTWKAKSC